MSRRKVYSIRWQKTRWVCRELKLLKEPRNKTSFVRGIAAVIRQRWYVQQQLGQLRVYGKHGRIQFERTYGRDPRQYKG